MAITDIISQAASVCSAVTGISNTFTDMPENLGTVFPCIVIYDKSCDQAYPRTPMQKQYEHQIYVNLYYAQGTNLPAADAALKQLIEPIYDAFNQNVTLNGTCTDSAIIHHDYGYVSYGGTNYVGIQFTLQVIESIPYTYHS
jgi:hypothetical protein